MPCQKLCSYNSIQKLMRQLANYIDIIHTIHMPSIVNRRFYLRFMYNLFQCYYLNDMLSTQLYAYSYAFSATINDEINHSVPSFLAKYGKLYVNAFVSSFTVCKVQCFPQEYVHYRILLQSRFLLQGNHPQNVKIVGRTKACQGWYNSYYQHDDNHTHPTTYLM